MSEDVALASGGCQPAGLPDHPHGWAQNLLVLFLSRMPAVWEKLVDPHSRRLDVWEGDLKEADSPKIPTSTGTERDIIYDT